MSLYDPVFKILKQHRGVAPLDVVKNTLHERFSMHMINDYLNAQSEDFQISGKEIVSIEAGFASFKELFFKELRNIHGIQIDHENFILHFLDLFKELKNNNTDFKIPDQLFEHPDRFKAHVRQFMSDILNLYERRILYHPRFITLIFEALYTDQFRTETFPAPDSIVDLFSRFTPEKKELNIYNPAAGGLKLLMGVADSTNAKVAFTASERNKLAQYLSNIYASMLGYFPDVDFEKPEQHISKQISENAKYDYIISVPPLDVNTEKKFGHYVRAPQNIISLSLALFKDDTRGVFLLPADMLDSKQSNTVAFRKELLDSGKLHTVIVLPQGILQPYTSVQPALLLLQKKQKREVRFLDASGEDFYTRRPDKSLALKVDKIMKLLVEDGYKKGLNEENIANEPVTEYNSSNKLFGSSANMVFEDSIRNNNFSLNAFRLKQEQFFPEEEGYVDLGWILSDSYVSFDRHNKEDVPYVTDHDLNGKLITGFEGFIRNTFTSKGKIISGSAFLIARRGNKFKPTWLESDYKVELSDNIIVIGINKDKVHPPYLLKELNSGYCLEQMKQLSSGTVLKQLREDDLLKVRVKLPSLEEQKRLVPDFYAEAKQETAIGLNDFASLVKHETGNQLLPMRVFLNSLPGLLKQYGVPEDAIYAKGVNTTILQKIQSLKKGLESVESMAKKLNDIFYVGEKAFRPEKEKKLESFLDEELRKAPEAQEIEIVIKSETGHEIEAEVDKEKFVLMLQNIVKNVADHNDLEDGILLEARITEHENNILINFMNTGNGLPTGFLDEDFIGFRKKSADSSGQGLGGFLINKIVEIHSGSLHILSPETDFENNRIFAFDLQIIIPKTQ